MSAALRAIEMQAGKLTALRSAITKWRAISTENTDEKLARMSGMHREAINRFRNGAADLSDPSHCRLAAALGLTIVVTQASVAGSECCGRCVNTIDLFEKGE